MALKIHTAMVKEPLPYRASRGDTRRIPRGPCLVEPIGDRLVLVTWGDEGEHSAIVRTEDLEAALEERRVELCD
jgi:hypothetical protein